MLEKRWNFVIFSRTFTNIQKMNSENNIPEPFIFNPLKHHLEYIRKFISLRVENENVLKSLLKELKHIGISVMDVYSGTLTSDNIFSEVTQLLILKNLSSPSAFGNWTGKKPDDYKVVTLSDSSRWALKYHNDKNRYVHIFPARLSPHSFRVKANTMKSAILYYIMIGKDYITGDDLNRARALMGLSPVKDPAEAEAITETIEILRG
jgi:hypothetical protein